tara:strand:- start:269 stop:448 length:180 start_codon:yes stop_codon:yes gene_type:complete
MKLLKPCLTPQKIVTSIVDKGSAIASVILIVLKILPTPLLVSLEGSTINGMSHHYFSYL